MIPLCNLRVSTQLIITGIICCKSRRAVNALRVLTLLISGNNLSVVAPVYHPEMRVRKPLAWRQ